MESIYVDAGDLSCDPCGTLLQLRKSSTLFVLRVLHNVLSPLARLSQMLQTSSSNKVFSTAIRIEDVGCETAPSDFSCLEATENEAKRPDSACS
jgi:hypothetical protein